MKISNISSLFVLICLFWLAAIFTVPEAHAQSKTVNERVIIDKGGLILVRGGTVDFGSQSVLSFSDAVLSGASFGTSTLTAAYATHSYPLIQSTIITLTDVPLVTSGNTSDGSETNAWGSVKLYDFPEGRILIHGVLASGLAVTPITNAIPTGGNGNISLGSVAASTNDLAATMVNLLPATAVDNISATNSVNNALAASAQFDGTTSALDLYLNLGVDDDDWIIGAASITNTVSGEILLLWQNLGDY